MSTVLARMGDIFEGSAQVTVLPCSGKGTVSSAVRRWLTMFDIPSPKDIPSRPQFGEVSDLTPFKGEKSITTHIVFAASVLNDFSSLEIINKIAAKLGELTQTNADIRVIETPLLGTGAGGLKTEVAGKALYQGFKSTAHPDSTLYVFVFDRERQITLQTLFNNLVSVHRVESVDEVQSANWVYLAELHKLLMEHFDQGELKTLCLYMGVDYDILNGEGKANKARELVQYLERRGRITELKNEVTKQRPHISWPAISQAVK